MLQRAGSVSRVSRVVVVAALCTGFAFVVTADQPGEQSPDAQTIEIGKTLYTDQCESCHGAQGKGDGPAARFLDPPARDLSTGDFQRASEPTVAAVAEVIKVGVDDTGMTPFEGTLSDDEITAVATYVVEVLAKQGDDGR
jgi:high-affinity iron transporter